MTKNLSRFLTHVSPSSLNLWMANPRQWAWQYLVRERTNAGPAAWRGTAVENGLSAMLRGKMPLLEAVKLAHNTFDQNAAEAKGVSEEKLEEERAMIGPMLDNLSKLPFPELHATQIKIEYWLDGVDVPCIGYVDFAFEDGDMDLKTSSKCPSKPHGYHVRQVSLYRAARNKPGRLLYVTEKRFSKFDVTDEMRDLALDDMTRAAKSLSYFLGKCENADDAVAALPYNPDDFRTSKLLLRGTASGFEPVDIGERP